MQKQKYSKCGRYRELHKQWGKQMSTLPDSEDHDLRVIAHMTHFIKVDVQAGREDLVLEAAEYIENALKHIIKRREMNKGEHRRR